jgi:pimeloyl-ACP methyl ester carboxylesterase
MGQGPGVILVHGGMQASQNFMRLATALADEFTVYVPDRRGRGMSGTYGNAYSIQRDVEDLEALLRKTGAHNVFGLSSGALIALQSALLLPTIQKLALYEPPLSIDHSAYPYWVIPFDEQIARGELGAAMLTVIEGTGDTSLFNKLPGFMTGRFLNAAIKRQSDEVQGDDVPMAKLIPTMHYDAQIVVEMEGTLDTFRDVSADVLLLGGSKSADFLKGTLTALETVLPHLERFEFPGFDHIAADNNGHPERVAEELRRFFR